MKIKLSSWQSWLILGLILATGVLVGVFIDVAQQTAAQGSPSLVIGILNAQAVINHLAWWIFLATVVAAVDIYYLFKGANLLINHCGASNMVTEAMYMIPVTCRDQEIIDYAATLKISVETTRVNIPPETLKKCSPEGLAALLCWLFYFQFDEIVEYARRNQRQDSTGRIIYPYTAFDHLADLLARYWTDRRAEKFYNFVKIQKEYIGKVLEETYKIRALERVVEFSLQDIAEKRLRLFEAGRDTRRLEEVIGQCRLYLSGHSVLLDWLKKKAAKFWRAKTPEKS